MDSLKTQYVSKGIQKFFWKRMHNLLQSYLTAFKWIDSLKPKYVTIGIWEILLKKDATMKPKDYKLAYLFYSNRFLKDIYLHKRLLQNI